MTFYKVTARTRTMFTVLFPVILVCLNQGFDVGAFGSLLYRNVISAWIFVASMLLGLLYIRFFEKKHVEISRFAILFIPAFWPAVDYVDHHISNRYIHYFILFDYIIVIFGLGYAAYLFLRLIKADIFDALNLRNKLFIGLMAVVFSGLGFLFGYHNSLLLECSHFKLSGDYIPHNCKKATDKGADFRTLYRQVW